MILLCSVEETTVWIVVDWFAAMCIVSASSSGGHACSTGRYLYESAGY
jgi:hypothetical protein